MYFSLARGLFLYKFAAFIVGDSCDQINLALVAIDEKIGYDGEGKCFDVIATLKNVCGSSWLHAIYFVFVCCPGICL